MFKIIRLLKSNKSYALLLLVLIIVSCNNNNEQQYKDTTQRRKSFTGKWKGDMITTTILNIDTLRHVISVDHYGDSFTRSHTYYEEEYVITDSNKIQSKIFSKAARYCFDEQGRLFFKYDVPDTAYQEFGEVLFETRFYEERAQK